MGSVSTDEARNLVASNEVDVIDIRDDDGWTEGHIPGAHRAGDDLEAKVESLDSDRRLLIVCEDGKRSSEVAEELDGGDREAVSLEGGMSSWSSDGLRTQPTEDYEPASSEDGDESREDAAEAEAEAESA